MMIDNERLAHIKRLLDKIEYDVIGTRLEATITPIYDNYAYEVLKEDLFYFIEIMGGDLLFLGNRNLPYYICPHNINNLSNLKIKNIDVIGYNVKNGYFEIGFYDSDDENEELENGTFTDRIYKKIDLQKASSRGYSQSDWDEYHILTSKKLTKEKTKALENIKKILSSVFTVQEYDITIKQITTRQYKDGSTEEVETELDNYGEVSYDGYTDDIEKEITEKYKDIKIINR